VGYGGERYQLQGPASQIGRRRLCLVGHAERATYIRKREVPAEKSKAQRPVIRLAACYAGG